MSTTTRRCRGKKKIRGEKRREENKVIELVCAPHYALLLIIALESPMNNVINALLLSLHTEQTSARTTQHIIGAAAPMQTNHSIANFIG